MSKMWPIFPVEPDDPLHLRAIWGKGVRDPQPTENFTFTEAEYPAVADRQRAFEARALKLNRQGFNIYTSLNPVNPSFTGNERNRLAVKDIDIARRRYILIDIDRAETSQPATDDEVDEIFRSAFEIERDFFFDKGHEPVTVNSGNGAHIYLPIDLPNNDETKALCQRMLLALAAKYDTPTVKIDTSVYTAGRITKVPGTVARKGIEVPDDTGINERAYRMAHVAE